MGLGCATLSIPLWLLFATLRLRGRPGEMVVKVHCGTVLREAFSTWRQIRPPKQCTLTTISPGLPRNLNVANYEVADETGLNFVHKAIPQCNLTPRTNNRSGVTLKGFPEPERVL